MRNENIVFFDCDWDFDEGGADFGFECTTNNC